MQMGPLQIVLIGFPDDDTATDRIMAELEALHSRGTVNLLDILFVRKDEAGETTTYAASKLYDDESALYGTALKRLLGAEGLGDAGEAGQLGNAYGLSAGEVRSLLGELPNGSAAGVLLFEHTWAAPLGALVAEAGGWLMAQGILTRDAVMVMGDEVRAIAAAEATISGAQAVRGAVILDTLAFVDEVETARAGLAAGVTTGVAADVVRSLIIAGVIDNDEVEIALAALVSDGLLDLGMVKRALVAAAAAEAELAASYSSDAS